MITYPQRWYLRMMSKWRYWFGWSPGWGARRRQWSRSGTGSGVGKGTGFSPGPVLIDWRLSEFANPGPVLVFTRKFSVIADQMCLKIKLVVLWIHVCMYEIMYDIYLCVYTVWHTVAVNLSVPVWVKNVYIIFPVCADTFFEGGGFLWKTMLIPHLQE